VRIAQDNEEFADTFDLSHPHKHLRWAVTVIFYAAVHYVEAYFDLRYNRHHNSHKRRQRSIRNNGQLRRIYNLYRSLEDESRNARYDGKNFSPDDVEDLKGNLENIKEEMRRLGVI